MTGWLVRMNTQCHVTKMGPSLYMCVFIFDLKLWLQAKKKSASNIEVVFLSEFELYCLRTCFVTAGVGETPKKSAIISWLHFPSPSFVSECSLFLVEV